MLHNLLTDITGPMVSGGVARVLLTFITSTVLLFFYLAGSGQKFEFKIILFFFQNLKV